MSLRTAIWPYTSISYHKRRLPSNTGREAWFIQRYSPSFLDDETAARFPVFFWIVSYAVSQQHKAALSPALGENSPASMTFSRSALSICRSAYCRIERRCFIRYGDSIYSTSPVMSFLSYRLELAFGAVDEPSFRQLVCRG